MANSLFAPLKNPLFRGLWLASLFSNAAVHIDGLAAAWLMTDLTTSPFWISMVGVASTLPAAFIALPAGTLADAFGKRFILSWALIWSSLCSLLLAASVFAGWISPLWLIAFLVILSFGRAARIPIWQAVVYDVVGKKHLSQGISLNSMSFNATRAFAPSAGGLLIGIIGIGPIFFINSIASLFMLRAVRRLKHAPPTQRPSLSSLLAGVYEAFCYLLNEKSARRTLLRMGCFIMGASALWAVLPLLGRDRFGLNSGQYGLLLSGFGVASVLGAAFLPRLQYIFGYNGILILAGVCSSFGIACVALGNSIWIAAGGLYICGLFFVLHMLVFSLSSQRIAPDTLRSRAMSFHFMTLQASWALGSFLAGIIGSKLGVTTMLLCAAAFLLLGTLVGTTFPIAFSSSKKVKP
ncbi:MAG: MFS transporter [Chthoniobacterales bacterium]